VHGMAKVVLRSSAVRRPGVRARLTAGVPPGASPAGGLGQRELHWEAINRQISGQPVDGLIRISIISIISARPYCAARARLAAAQRLGRRHRVRRGRRALRPRGTSSSLGPPPAVFTGELHRIPAGGVRRGGDAPAAGGEIGRRSTSSARWSLSIRRTPFHAIISSDEGNRGRSSLQPVPDDAANVRRAMRNRAATRASSRCTPASLARRGWNGEPHRGKEQPSHRGRAVRVRVGRARHGLPLAPPGLPCNFGVTTSAAGRSNH
jgi:hypothetical protein